MERNEYAKSWELTVGNSKFPKAEFKRSFKHAVNASPNELSAFNPTQLV